MSSPLPIILRTSQCLIALSLAAMVLVSCGSSPTPTPAPTKSTRSEATATKQSATPATGETPLPAETPRPAGPSKPTAAAASTPLREVDWAQVLQNDPDLERKTIPSHSELGGLWVNYKGTEAGGYPLLNTILYGDLRGDGNEEAVISLESGGTAGITGILVYAPTPSGPRIVAARGAQKLYAQIQDGQLVVQEPVYASWEPNCCPSSLEITRYRLQGDDLISVKAERQPLPEAKVSTVEYYYGLLNQRRFQEAYAFLGPSVQATNPYDQWVAGFISTVSTDAQVQSGADGSVEVALTSTEQAADGSARARHFKGRWFLTFSEERNQWILDRAEIAESP